MPGGKLGLSLNVIVPALTWLILLTLTFREHARFGIPLLLVGPVVWLLVRRFRR